MKTTTAIRPSRPSACSNERRRIGHRALAASLAACVAVSWGAFSLATPAPASVASAPDGVLALEKACERGDAVRCNDLGVSHLRGYGVRSDAGVAGRWFARSCSEGSADGCGNLGALYENGIGVPASLPEAARLYARACTMGCALACSNLGALHARGRGVRRDLDEARRLFALACSTGSAAGCNNLIEFTSPPAEAGRRGAQPPRRPALRR